MEPKEPKEPKEKKAPEKKTAKKSSKKARVTDTHIKHHRNGSHTVSHVVEGGGEPIEYAAPDLEAVKAGMDEHVAGGGAPTEEAEAAPNPVMERLGQPSPAAAG